MLALAAGLLFCPAAFAETLYVTDILRLGLHDNSETSGEPIRVLASGDALEILQRSRYYAQVRTADGTEGWVKASYLTDQKPAQAMLAELTSERDRLSTDLAAVQSHLDENNIELQKLRSDRDNAKQQAASVSAELVGLQADNKLLAEKVAANKFSVPLRWLIGVAVLTLLGGFLGGWWWTDARQRARHGGFRI